MNTDTDNPFDRVPPQSIESEMCLLGSMMLLGNDDRLAAEIIADLHQEDFYLAENQIVFEIIRERRSARQAVDAVTIRASLESRGLLHEAGGTAHLAKILSSVPSAAHGPAYAAIVREKSKLRRAIDAANDLLRSCYSPTCNDSSADQIIQDSVGKIATICHRSAGTRYSTTKEIMENTLCGIESGNSHLLMTGITPLDMETRGFAPGEVVIVAARPSMGKSTMMRTIALEMAKNGVPVGYISLEENEAKIGRNLIAAEASITNHKLRNADLTQQEWGRAVDAANRIANAKIYLSGRSSHIGQIKSISSLWRSRYGIQALFIDYIQLVTADGRSRYEQVTNGSRELALHTRDLGVVGIFAAQINRQPEAREDRHPRLSDLRESGQIEQDADFVLLLHREDYYRHQEADYVSDGLVEVEVAKARDSERGGVVTLKAELHFQRFTSNAPTV